MKEENKKLKRLYLAAYNARERVSKMTPKQKAKLEARGRKNLNSDGNSF